MCLIVKNKSMQIKTIGVSKIKKKNIPQGCITSIKSDSKGIDIVTKIMYFKYMPYIHLYYLLSIYKKKWKKNIKHHR